MTAQFLTWLEDLKAYTERIADDDEQTFLPTSTREFFRSTAGCAQSIGFLKEADALDKAIAKTEQPIRSRFGLNPSERMAGKAAAIITGYNLEIGHSLDSSPICWRVAANTLIQHAEELGMISPEERQALRKGIFSARSARPKAAPV